MKVDNEACKGSLLGTQSSSLESWKSASARMSIKFKVLGLAELRDLWDIDEAAAARCPWVQPVARLSIYS